MAERISWSTETAVQHVCSQGFKRRIMLVQNVSVCVCVYAKIKSQSSAHVIEQKLVHGINNVLIRIESKCKAAVIDMSMCTSMSTVYNASSNPHE